MSQTAQVSQTNTMFQRARKAQSFLRMALAGPSGAGKTYTSLEVAVGLAAGRPIAVIDTERGSASKYADLFTFDVLELDNYHPERYIEAIEAAAAAGYAVLVIDSLSHGWNGVGGALELHDQAVKRQKTQNSYTAWADVTPLQNRLINAIMSAPLHVITTIRSKTEYVQDRNERGGTTIRKVGMAPIQRDGIEYEFDIFGQMDTDHNLIIEKSRCSALASAVIARPGAPLAATLTTWLQGSPPEQRPTELQRHPHTTAASVAGAESAESTAPEPDLQLASPAEQRSITNLCSRNGMNTGQVRALVARTLQRPEGRPLGLELLKRGESDLTKSEFRALFNALTSPTSPTSAQAADHAATTAAERAAAR